MGWTVPRVSSLGSGFNVDFGVSFPPGQTGASYTCAPVENPGEGSPGLSVFALEGGEVFHPSSCHARGLEPLNSADQLLDLVPKGRGEGSLPWSMAWLRRHDAYDAYDD
jgi:predicted dithiol-disulfide oxidoreductase (DUF899 family)